MKISNDRILRMQTQQAFDYLRVHEGELSRSQLALVKSLRRYHKENGLTEKQLAVLFDIYKAKRPGKKTLLIRNY